MSYIPTTSASGATTSSGTYTPSLTNGANIAASTAYQCQYLQVGSVVTVSGKVDIDPTAGATGTILNISLPIASNVTNEGLGGAGTTNAFFGGEATIQGDAGNKNASFGFVSDAVAINNTAWFFTFTYLII